MQDYSRLRVWQRAQQLIVEIDRDLERVDERTHPGVASRLRLAVAAISRNIAEGTEQPTASLFARSLMSSISSANDVLHQLTRARELGIIAAPRHVMLDFEVQEIRRMLFALRGKVIERIRGARAKR